MMLNTTQPSLVPKTTTTLANTAQADRNRQVKAYNKDASHNQSQMDSVRHAQYSKQNKAVNSQKSQMQRNAAKSSRKVTGTSDFYKEGKTYEQFITEAPALPPAGQTGRGGAMARRPRPTQTDANSDVIDVDVQDVTSRQPGMGKREFRQRQADMAQQQANLDQRRFAYQQQRDRDADRRREDRDKAREDERKRKEKQAARDRFNKRVGRVIGNPMKNFPSLTGLAGMALDTSNKGQSYNASGPTATPGRGLPQVDD